MTATKPVLSLEGARLFYEIVAHVRRHRKSYRANPSSLPTAASDVMDGGYIRRDRQVIDLTQKQIIRRVALQRGDYTLAGVTWELTPYGCQLIAKDPSFDPHRKATE